MKHLTTNDTKKNNTFSHRGGTATAGYPEQVVVWHSVMGVVWHSGVGLGMT